jgi:hypothetical protein
MHNLTDDDLEFFGPHEFGEFWRFMSGRLLVALDRFRRSYGDIVSISPAPGAIGRWGGPFDYVSAHDVERHGEVLGVDVMPRNFTATPEENARVYQIAKASGFIGLGIYPEWRPQAGLHLDVMLRPNRRAYHLLAKWRAYWGPDPDRTGKLKQHYTGVADIMPDGWKP